MRFPLIQEIPYQEPQHLFEYFKDQPGAIFLDSARCEAPGGRYSFIAYHPFTVISSKDGLIKKDGVDEIQGNPWQVLKTLLQKFKQETVPDLPPFQGGAVGFLGYELYQHLENLPVATRDEMQFDDMIMGFYDVVLSFDGRQKKAWIISSGYPEMSLDQRFQRAQARLGDALAFLTSDGQPKKNSPSVIKNSLKAFMSSKQYQEKIDKIIEYIRTGDVFEVNLTQQFTAELPPQYNAYGLYQRLRQQNPAPFAAFLNFSPTFIVSASPERFVSLKDRRVEARPIKGTRRRDVDVLQDKALAESLLQSEKDRAENIMIVDLLRNDLSKVCEDDSVHVLKLCGLESYATVHHLVSVIEGLLQEGLDAIDLLCALFPGGSITGAPKIRAMEIISELEGIRRGPYCGSIAYIGFDGAMDASITIRTLCIQDQKIVFQAGGAITLDSLPLDEYEEVLTKVAPLIKALGIVDDFAH